MKQKHFYSHLVQVNDITLDLAELDMTQEERLKLLALIDANVHSTVIDTILSELSEEEKKVFLKNMISDDHEAIWVHLKKNSKGIEDKIRLSVENLIKDMRQDIRRARLKR